jgi:hypothetical protein
MTKMDCHGPPESGHPVCAATTQTKSQVRLRGDDEFSTKSEKDHPRADARHLRPGRSPVKWGSPAPGHDSYCCDPSPGFGPPVNNRRVRGLCCFRRPRRFSTLGKPCRITFSSSQAKTRPGPIAGVDEGPRSARGPVVAAAVILTGSAYPNASPIPRKCSRKRARKLTCGSSNVRSLSAWAKRAST